MEFIGFIFVQIVLLCLAALVGGLCIFVVMRATRHVVRDRGKALAIAFVFPIATLVYLELVLFGTGLVSYLRGEDSFLDGRYHYRLTGDYQLEIFDEFPWAGTIEAVPGAEKRVRNVPGAIRGTQVAGKWILASARDLDDWSSEDKAPNRFFILDTEKHSITYFDTLESLRSKAAKANIALQLTPTERMLGRPSDSIWWNRARLVIALLPVLFVAAWLLSRLQRLRRGIVSCELK